MQNVSIEAKEMDAKRITAVIRDLMKLLQNMSKEDDDKLFCKQKHCYENVEFAVKELKEELGSWFVADCQLNVGS